LHDDARKSGLPIAGGGDRFEPSAAPVVLFPQLLQVVAIAAPCLDSRIRHGGIDTQTFCSGSLGSPVVRSPKSLQVPADFIDRTVAGVHFPVDTAVGQVLGLTLGRYFIQRATGGAQQFNAWRFDGERYPGTQDFDFHDFYDSATALEQLNPAIDPPYVDRIASQRPEVSPVLKWLWDEAAKEWA
jgi:hypothetical protein